MGALELEAVKREPVGCGEETFQHLHVGGLAVGVVRQGVGVDEPEHCSKDLGLNVFQRDGGGGPELDIAYGRNDALYSTAMPPPE